MTEPSPSPSRGVRTRAVHGASEPAPGPVNLPLVRSATFSFPSLAAMRAEQELGSASAFYQRIGHPTLHAAEERLAAIENSGGAVLFSSGMAAISSVLMSRLRSGDHAVALRQCYGGSLDVLKWGAEQLGWSYDLVDAREPSDWERALHRETRVFLVESPTNPTLCVLDLAHAASVAHRHGALLAVDNTIASPVGQAPLTHGADLSIYSATKSIGGHSDLLAGAVLGSEEALDPIWRVRTTLGAVPDPSAAWLIERSLKTLPLRVERANATALELARRLSARADVTHVYYPGLERHPGHDVARRQMTMGFGPLLSFERTGGAAAAEAAVDRLALIRHAPSLGGVESLAALPAFTSHRRMTPEERAVAGIGDGLVRLSIGIEDVGDLWADLEQALAPSP